MPISQEHADTFKHLVDVAKADRLCVMECTNTHTSAKESVVCEVLFDPDDPNGEEYELVPLARLFNESPYDFLKPPTVETDNGK